MENVFKFKKFEINQSCSAMKINTDGVLLGAVATHSNPKSILDIGTGTGVIAMMMAQRFPKAIVDAVEIDEPAAVMAAVNFQSSVFGARCSAYHTDITAYRKKLKYDLIVSNPPYFVNDLKNTETRKQVARHADESFFESLFKKVSLLLTPMGCVWLILPVKQATLVIEKSVDFGLMLTRQINISSDADKPVIRQMICLNNLKAGLKPMTEPEIFYIYEKQDVYSSEYKELLKDFFLAF